MAEDQQNSYSRDDSPNVHMPKIKTRQKSEMKKPLTAAPEVTQREEEMKILEEDDVIPPPQT